MKADNVAATTQDQLQAMLNARLAKSQAARGAVGGYPAEQQQQSPVETKPVLERVDTWSKAPDVVADDSQWHDNDPPVAQVRPVLGRLGSWTRAPDADPANCGQAPGAGRQRGRALIRSLTKSVEEAQPVAPEVGEQGLPVGRLLPTRSRSIQSRHRTEASSAQFEGYDGDRNERSSSVPPQASVSTVVWAAARLMRRARLAKQARQPSEKTALAINEDAKEEDEGAFPLMAVIMAAVRFARPLTVSGRRVREVLPAEKALGRDVRRQLRLVVAGLMGSGKSTLCRMLAHLLGGKWVNQDEFSHRGKGAKKAFLEEIEREAQDKKIPVLIVD